MITLIKNYQTLKSTCTVCFTVFKFIWQNMAMAVSEKADEQQTNVCQSKRQRRHLPLRQQHEQQSSNVIVFRNLFYKQTIISTCMIMYRPDGIYSINT